jgi:hypothetical protein
MPYLTALPIFPFSLKFIAGKSISLNGKFPFVIPVLVVNVVMPFKQRGGIKYTRMYASLCVCPG